MSEHSDDEDLTECALTPELEQRLVATVRGCTFRWANRAGEPFGVMMSYLPRLRLDGAVMWQRSPEVGR